MPRHQNMHNTRSSASYDSRYDENEHHSNSEDQEEDLDDGDGSESEEFNNLFDAPNDVTKERKGYASSSSSSSSDSSEANCSSSSELSSLTSAKPPRRLGNSDNLPTNPQTSLKKYLPKLFAVPNSKAQKPILLASADKNFSAGIALYKIVAQKDEDIKNYVAGAKACVKGKEDVIKVLKSEIKKLEKKCDSLSQVSVDLKSLKREKNQLGKELTQTQNRLVSQQTTIFKLQDEKLKLQGNAGEAALVPKTRAPKLCEPAMSEREKADLDIMKLREKAALKEQGERNADERKRLTHRW